jgi:streptomycin 6-kinase
MPNIWPYRINWITLEIGNLTLALIMNIPPKFIQTMNELYGTAGKEWIDQLPALITTCEKRWSLTVLPPFAPLSYNYVAPALCADGKQVVLKLGFPNPELSSEIEALRWFGGRGIAQLLQGEPQQGILLIERVNPGTLLSSLENDDQATHIAAQVMRQLWRPIPAGQTTFIYVAKWAKGLERLRRRFNGETGPFPTLLVEEAENLFADLLASMGAPVLLHGDLHHENILSAQRQPWLAIDPKGVVGEPAYEAGALLRNPGRILKSSELERITARRLDLLAEDLQLERSRLRAWGLAQAVLSAWWHLEDHGHGWEESLHLAEVLSKIKA